MSLPSPDAVVFFMDHSASMSNAHGAKALEFIIRERTERYADRPAFLCQLAFKMQDQKVLDLTPATIQALIHEGFESLGQYGSLGGSGMDLESSLREGMKLPALQGQSVSQVVVVTDGEVEPPRAAALGLSPPPPDFLYALVSPEEGLTPMHRAFAEGLDHGKAALVSASFGLDAIEVPSLPSATSSASRRCPAP